LLSLLGGSSKGLYLAITISAVLTTLFGVFVDGSLLSLVWLIIAYLYYKLYQEPA